MRSVAKLCLNSFLGKFGQRGNLPQTLIVRSYAELLKLLHDPEKTVHNSIIATEDIMYVSWSYKKESASNSNHTNVANAAYTTAQAPLKLYDYLYKLGERVLYYDTDSIIVTSNIAKNEYEPPTGTLLADLTDELESYGEGAFIKRFISGRPKFYGYRVQRAAGEIKETCKIKGIRLNYGNGLKISFASILELIKNHNSDDDSLNNFI